MVALGITWKVEKITEKEKYVQTVRFPALQAHRISGFNELANCNQVSTV
jgi:hypothetical protein